MDCSEARTCLSGYVDGELDAADNALIEAHLRACAECAQTFRDYSLLRSALREHAAATPDLDGLRSAIEARLPPPRRRPRYALALAFAATVVLTSGLGFWYMWEPAEERLTDVAVSAHMRSLQGNHLTDFASADPNAVGTWLSARLQRELPVRDLQADGYELVGGRLDYMYKWQVGALVYRRSGHLINVFLWPVGDTEFPRRTLADEGFHVVFWARSGLNFCAISDLGAEELARFTSAYNAS
ncbi:MAG TPA: zf-HC2 domain-containing protein [Aromatoleum sp.]|uniref:anti-sigma factor family protein n=1 Tax=Aromatoleum sp. TaxID=2307007 RepID=UPI002B470831|nr:zf-HC2 domain-containing protein [Aromatoleum sp.]HJV26014.1 zf-HC2 domain-containing protein [Aromatoleum sp.]